MPKKTYAEFICKQHPELREMAEYYASLGFAEPVLWAESEQRGEPSVAQAALIYALRSEISASDNTQWIERIRQGELSFENAKLLKAAQDVLESIERTGIDLGMLTPLVSLIQSQVVSDVSLLLDHGPAISGIPLPAGREAHWQLFAVNEEGEPQNEICGFGGGICDDDS
ncbi:MAG: hypothetical protein WAV95_19850 [Azonexus sp.]